MLTFVGLGLYDERSITVRGRDALRGADRAFAEFYTSRLAGTTLDDLETSHGVDIEVRDRAGVEERPGEILAAATDSAVVFLTGGDPMVATTHVDLRLRAADRGIDTRVVHGTTAGAAASSLTGLQNYRFGKATTLPFERSTGTEGVPGSVLGTIDGNRERGLHTLVFLDIDAEGAGDVGTTEGSYMTADEAASRLVAARDRRDEPADALAVAVGRAGSDDPTVVADRLSALADREFGPPLHLLVLPGDLHPVEADALARLAGAPDSLLDRDR